MRIGATALLCLLTLCGCTSPTRKAADFAGQHGFTTDTFAGTLFKHRLYRSGPSAGGTLHVYIEGDGTPFIHSYTVAEDPTPRTALMLHLMALDPDPSIYLGRPCYFGLYREGACTPVYWTQRRFSAEVVDSMAAVVIAEASKRHAKDIALFGHSGGGTLAVLLSARIPGVTRVVTIGANLNINAWCALHNYTPLTGSLNPIDTRVPEQGIRTLHLVGSDDKNTPPTLLRDATAAGAPGTVRVINGFTHNCCWDRIWSGVLGEAP